MHDLVLEVIRVHAFSGVVRLIILSHLRDESCTFSLALLDLFTPSKRQLHVDVNKSLLDGIFLDDLHLFLLLNLFLLVLLELTNRYVGLV